jgi:hypothetical protein
MATDQYIADEGALTSKWILNVESKVATKRMGVPSHELYPVPIITQIKEKLKENGMVVRDKKGNPIYIIKEVVQTDEEGRPVMQLKALPTIKYIDVARPFKEIHTGDLSVAQLHGADRSILFWAGLLEFQVIDYGDRYGIDTTKDANYIADIHNHIVNLTRPKNMAAARLAKTQLHITEGETKEWQPEQQKQEPQKGPLGQAMDRLLGKDKKPQQNNQQGEVR